MAIDRISKRVFGKATHQQSTPQKVKITPVLSKNCEPRKDSAIDAQPSSPLPEELSPYREKALFSEAPLKDGIVNFSSLRRSDRSEDDGYNVQTPNFSFEKSDSIEVFKRMLEREKQQKKAGSAKFRSSAPLKGKLGSGTKKSLKQEKPPLCLTVETKTILSILPKPSSANRSMQRDAQNAHTIKKKYETPWKNNGTPSGGRSRNSRFNTPVKSAMTSLGDARDKSAEKKRRHYKKFVDRKIAEKRAEGGSPELDKLQQELCEYMQQKFNKTDVITRNFCSVCPPKNNQTYQYSPQRQITLQE